MPYGGTRFQNDTHQNDFPLWVEDITDMTPQRVRKCSIKNEKKKKLVKEERLLTIPGRNYKKEKLKFELCLFRGMSLPLDIFALHLCNYLVPHIL